MRAAKPEWHLSLAYPKEELFLDGTDNDMANIVRTLPDGGFFRCGCRMSLGAKKGVVDANLNVHGIKPKTIKCINSSVCPFPPNAIGRENSFITGLNAAEIIFEDQ